MPIAAGALLLPCILEVCRDNKADSITTLFDVYCSTSLSSCGRRCSGWVAHIHDHENGVQEPFLVRERRATQNGRLKLQELRETKLVSDYRASKSSTKYGCKGLTSKPKSAATAVGQKHFMFIALQQCPDRHKSRSILTNSASS